MAKKATITERKAGRSWKNDFGTFYPYWIKLDNNEDGTLNTKDEPGKNVQVGHEIWYELTPDERGNKIKLVKPPEGITTKPGDLNQSKPEIQIMIVRQSSLKIAVDYYNLFNKSGEPVTPNDIKSLADEFTKWVMS